ncbi:MAG: gliding motility-associated C-terminal domain-containing protein [Bacteroidetes bacterium]|nr:gliding motility-associated C-terminal domain-containing protein [Bacteroidota bacterium]
MKKLLLFIFVLLISFDSFSQGAPACPSITPTATPPIICEGASSNLNATVVSNNQTSSYSVASIPYVPYAFTGGTGVSVNTDDVWSPVMNLGFSFCFFGNAYTQAVIGSNGHLTFDLSYASGYDSYPVTTSLPSTSNMPGNTISAVFRDIDPSISGSVNYYTTGTAPCRALVISWYDVGLFSCSTPHSTFQMVLYENTNYIDVYIQDSPGSCSWQNGNGIVGIQNAAATVAVCPPGRNCAPFTAANEAWRFSPAGAPSYTVTWTDPSSAVVGTGLGPISVSPAANTTYTSTMVITNCAGAPTTYTNTVNVVVQAPIVSTFTQSPSQCLSGNSFNFTNTGVSGAGYTQSWNFGGAVVNTSTAVSPTGITYSAVGTYSITHTITDIATGCTSTTTSTVSVNNQTPPNFAPIPSFCSGSTAPVLSATSPNGITGSWSPSIVNNTANGTYTFTPDAGQCATVQTLNTVISPQVVPNFTPIPAFCNGSVAPILSTTSPNGITGTWSPAVVSNTTSGSYIFTPVAGECATTQTLNVTVTANPVLSVNNATICLGIPATITPTGATSYLWNTGSSANPLVVSPATTTTYTVVGNTNGCTGTAISTVTVNPNPLATATSAIVCSGVSANLTAGGGIGYLWSTGSSNSTISVSPTITTTYNVSVTDANGCTSTANSVVTVNQNPIADAGNAQAICTGNTAVLTASGGSSYLWNTSETTASISVSPSISTTYQVTVTNANSCTATDQVAVTITPDPVVSANNSTICSGLSTNITPVGATTYLWNTGATSNPLVVSPITTTTYTVTGTTNGCTGTAISVVTVNQSPVINAVANNNNTCQPMLVPFTDNSTPTIVTYSWDFGDPGSSTNNSNIQNPTHNYLNGGSYNVTITVTTVDGCSGTYTYTNMVTVYSNPIANFSATPPVASILTPVIAFQDQSNGTNSWYWSFGDPLSGLNNNSSIQNPSHVYTVEGFYDVTLVVITDHGCIDTLKKTVEIINDVLTIPNIITPNGDGKNDVFKITNIEKVPNNHLVIFNRWGKIVYEKDGYNNEWDGGNCPDGVYFIILTYKDSMEHKGTVTILNEK